MNQSLMRIRPELVVRGVAVARPLGRPESCEGCSELMVSISLGLMCDIHSSSCLESDSISAIFSRAESITSSASGAVSSVISDGSSSSGMM